ncbi:MAG: hypothetical protein JSW25_00195 [Thermoplasmata archaeon]|nr:MAG: hypothetical protein JSW25_00195 [Thermoplasmata archaeon]
MLTIPDTHDTDQPVPGRYDRHLWWATTALKAVMVVLAIVAVFRGPEVWVYSGIFCAVFAFVPTVIRRATGLSMPVALEFLLFLALFLHVGGGALGIYDMFGPWDMVTHFVSTFMLALFGFTLVFIANHQWAFMTMTPGRVILVTMVIAMSLGFIWEGMEWAADKLFDIRAQDGIADTLMDLVMDAVGGLAASLLAVRWVANGTLEGMTKDLSRVLGRAVAGAS